MKTTSPTQYLLLALCIGFTACSKHTTTQRESLQKAHVQVVPVELKPYITTEQVMGTVRPKVRAILEANLRGRIEQLPIVQGQRMGKGELIAELDVREVKARLDQTEAIREQAQRELKRQRVLVQQQSATQADFDAVESRYRSANASVAEAEAMLAYGEVRAPFDGIIIRKLAEVGDLALPGKPIAEIEQTDSLRFEADVPETLISGIALGNKLPVRIPAVGKTFEGIVREIAPAADSTTRTVLIKLELPDNIGLRSGLFGEMDVPVKEVTTLRIPHLAVIHRGQMEIAFVITNDTAHLRLIKTGKRFDDAVEILSGISAGESVITDAANLSDGQPVVRE